MADSDWIQDGIDMVADVLDEALRTGDYSALGRNIGSMVKDATEAVSEKVQETADKAVAGVDYTRPDYNGRRRQGQHVRPYSQRNTVYGAGGQKVTSGRMTRAQQMREEAREKARIRAEQEARANKYFTKPADATGSTVITVVGGALGVIFGCLTLLFSIMAAASGSMAMVPLAVIMGIIAAAGIGMLVSGYKAAKKTARFKAYRMVLLPKLYADVDEIAEKTKIPEKTVVSDLESLSKNKMIKQGHFDKDKKTFIASDEIYQQYLDTARHAEEMRKAEEQKAKENAAYSPEVLALLENGNSCIKMIHDANDAIPDPEVTEKLNRMESIVRRIFAEVRKRPELAGSLNMFMDYYLPTTTKLINAYHEMDMQEVQGENIRNAKKEIAGSLDTINDAYEKLLDGFFKETAMDVSSDINVMKMMMKQDGLTPDDLSVLQEKQKAEARAKEAEARAKEAKARAEAAAKAQAEAAAKQEAEAREKARQEAVRKAEEEARAAEEAARRQKEEAYKDAEAKMLAAAKKSSSETASFASQTMASAGAYQSAGAAQAYQSAGAGQAAVMEEQSGS